MHNHISNFIALVLALGVGRILRFLAQTMTGESRSRHYFLYWIGVFFTFLLFVQYWWSYYDDDTRLYRRFDYILVVLLPVLLYYLIAELFYPTATKSEIIDLKAHYWLTIRKIGIIALLIQIILVLTDNVYSHNAVPVHLQIIRVCAALLLFWLVYSRSAVTHTCIYIVLGILLIVFVYLDPPDLKRVHQTGNDSSQCLLIDQIDFRVSMMVKHPDDTTGIGLQQVPLFLPSN